MPACGGFFARRTLCPQQPAKQEDSPFMARSITLRTEDTYQQRDRWSCVLLAEELRRICSDPRRESAELFRRKVFNALLSNPDDRPRNHAAIAKAKDWRLSPAYDLTPSMPISQERRDLAMNCGVLGRYAHAENLLSPCARLHLEREQARAIIVAKDMQVASTWYEISRRVGASEKDCETISSAFAYPGFRLPLEIIAEA